MPICERCKCETNVTTVSRFNTEEICIESFGYMTPVGVFLFLAHLSNLL